MSLTEAKSLCVMLCLLVTSCVMVQATANETAAYDVTTQAPSGTPPHIDVHPTGTLYKIDDRVVLECAASGTPTPTYTWYRDGQVLDADLYENIVESIAVDGRLEIDPAYAMDEGRYQCLAENDVASVFSKTAHVRRAKLASPVPMPPKDYAVKEGESLIMECTPLLSVPPTARSWVTTKAGLRHPLTLNDRITVDDEGRLYFSHVLPSDALDETIYSRTEFNSYLDTSATNCPSVINVTSSADAPDVTPQLVYRSDMTDKDEESTSDEEEAEVYATAGSTSTLTCVFSGKPAVDVSWTRSVGEMTTRHSASGTKLTISNVEKSDEDAYTCTGSNSVGEASGQIELQLATAPTFEKEDDGLTDGTARPGQGRTFECEAEASPEATVQWYVNGKIVADDDQYDIEDNGEELTIKEVTVEVGGVLVVQCEVTNIHGSVMSTAYVSITTSGSGSVYTSGLALC